MYQPLDAYARLHVSGRGLAVGAVCILAASATAALGLGVAKLAQTMASSAASRPSAVGTSACPRPPQLFGARPGCH
ncbi:MAG: hypothetical protein HY053_08720 [Proteobacteria bacterium]|nr:hypothetical protein [Pseudomonadota bacterium]